MRGYAPDAFGFALPAGVGVAKSSQKATASGLRWPPNPMIIVVYEMQSPVASRDRQTGAVADVGLHPEIPGVAAAAAVPGEVCITFA